MNYTEDQLAKFKSEFARRKRNQFIVAAPFTALFLGSVFFEAQLQELTAELSPYLVGGAFAVPFVGVLLFSIRNWRCGTCQQI